MKKLIGFAIMGFIIYVVYYCFTNFDEIQEKVNAFNSGKINVSKNTVVSSVDAIEKSTIIDNYDNITSNDVTNGIHRIDEYEVSYIGTKKPDNGVFMVQNNDITMALFNYIVDGSDNYTCYNSGKVTFAKTIEKLDGCNELKNSY